ncbi:MAG TPA: hypothetical protein VFS34_17820 [Thermoanaerobaculia bacterium]|nr:hypothetical protein [Thermoanaerobaculia bacterium]
MKIGGFRTASGGGSVRTEATIVWEDVDRPPSTLFFEIGGASAREPADPNAFVAATALPAYRRGERRIAVEAAVCPRLRDGIAAAAAVLGAWNRHEAPAPVIEPRDGFVPSRAPARRRAAVMASGGIDSAFEILRNRRELPRDHPLSFRAAIRLRDFVFPVDSSPERRAHVEIRSARAVSLLAEDAGLEEWEVSSNANELEPDAPGHLRWTHGSLLASVGLAAGSGLTDVTISASHDLRTGLRPWGSHPLLDPNFSTAALSIHHRGVETSRFRKTAEIARWPAALASLFVCGQGPLPGDAPNCGGCEKCVRTRVSLLLAAGIDDPPTFPPGRVSAADIEAVAPLEDFRLLSYYWHDIAGAARAAGRPDLAGAIARLISRQQAYDRWRRPAGWKGTLRRADERWLGGALSGLRRRFRR